MIATLSSMNTRQKEAVVDIAVLVACAAFLAGWVSSGIVNYVKAEASYREKVNFCHDRMKDGRIAYIWRQEYCGKTLDAVDPISGRPVMGVIEGDEK